MFVWLVLLLACSGTDPVSADDPAADADGDGSLANVDCDDTDPSVFPTADERCDGRDSACDGLVDEADDDGDGVLDCDVCEDAGYFTALAKGSELGSTLDALTDGVSCTYDRSREYLFSVIDNHDGVVTCAYTGQTFAIDDYPPDWNQVNTEHTWPQSQGAENEPAKCDLGHLFPVTTDANTARSDHPFGLVTQSVTWSGGGSKLGKDAAGNVVFEPRDVHKGNAARAMFYFAMRYDKPLSDNQTALFGAWSEQDPPTAADRLRERDVVRAQKEANPFVVCPGLVSAWLDAGSP